jgi:hypothetical protein
MAMAMALLEAVGRVVILLALFPRPLAAEKYNWFRPLPGGYHVVCRSVRGTSHTRACRWT